MKSKKNKKRKFKDFNYVNGNNNENGKNNEIAKKYEGKEYKTPLELLGEMFQGISGDTIEEIYISNNRNFVITKQTLELLCNDNDNNNNEGEEHGDMLLEDVEGLLKGNNDNKYSKGSNYKNGMDLTRFASFEIDSDIQCDINAYNNNNNKTSLSNNSNSNSNSTTTEVSSNQSKDSKINKLNDNGDYISIFATPSSTPSSSHETNHTNPFAIDSLFLDDYISLLSELFPTYTRQELTLKICEDDFDIDKTILSLFYDKYTDDTNTNNTNNNSNNNKESNIDLSKYENLEITNKEEILSNFASFDSFNENQINIDAITANNLQNEIEQQIKQDIQHNKSQTTNNASSSSLPQSSLSSNEEYFIDKPIDQIKTKSIKTDLMRLFKMFPFEDEFTIKWVYYQYMNFNLSYRYLYKKNNKKVNYGLHAIIDNNDQPPSLSSSSSSYQQPQHQMNNTNNNNNNNTHHNKILYRIINENPSQWKFANDNASINIREYQCIRHRLIREAQKAHAMKKHTQANAIMAKANRYKQEINNLIEKQKLNEFFKNNYDVNINDISPNILDLHGMSLDESKLILKHKLTHLQKQKQLNDITQTTTLTIITGKGNHSYQNIPILFPGIVKYLSANTNFKFKSNESQGVIKVYI